MLLVRLFVCIIGAFLPVQMTLALNQCKVSSRRYENSAKMLRMSGGLDFASLAAGSMAGALGVGVAYPLDSMKTKIQAYAAAHQGEKIDTLSVAKTVLKEGGFPSLYEGILGVMLGSSVIKATAFTTNSMALAKLAEMAPLTATGLPTIEQLTIAAAIAGLATALISNPIERVKVIMQVNTKGPKGASEIEVISEVLRGDGITGLLFRGVDASVAKDVPGYILYFVTYFNMVHSAPGLALGPMAPIIMGAMSGMFAWSLVFPLDVCKTSIQNYIGERPQPLSQSQWDSTTAVNSKGAYHVGGAEQVTEFSADKRVPSPVYNVMDDIEALSMAATTAATSTSSTAAANANILGAVAAQGRGSAATTVSVSVAAPAAATATAVLQQIERTSANNINAQLQHATKDDVEEEEEEEEEEKHCNNLLEAIPQLFAVHGPQVFIKGITPKLLQAAVAHSVTFFAYEHLHDFFDSLVAVPGGVV